MKPNLVIVESPAKAKTIEKFLGKEFIVKSSFGHIRDLSKKNFGIDINNNYTPAYEVMPDKKKVVAELRKLAKQAQTVWLASDEDREGEAIAWHLSEVLKLNGKAKRIVFHEITKTAILNAVENPGEIKIDLVNAQQARRILDRLVGFELSSVLWKKVKSQLSAGRVQSVSVRVLVDREREIMDFVPKAAFKTSAYFDIPNGNSTTLLKSDLTKKFNKKEEALTFLNNCAASEYSISKIEKKPGKRTPSPPFTTSTLQQEASRKLGFPVGKTMSVAQKLYEHGQITYMRTDSVNLSGLAMGTAKKTIIDTYGEKYYKARKYKTKAKGAQEAHEAIRPTFLGNENITGTYDEQRLYQLIRNRTLASQMSDAILEKTNVEIALSKCSEKFLSSGEVLVFEGFLKVYAVSTDDENEDGNTKGLLPPMQKNQTLDLNRIESIEKFTKHPTRYTEASLVKRLEDLGIGRPSTYAPTISTIQRRGYVIKEDRAGQERNFHFITYKAGEIKETLKTETHGAEKAKLFPTDIGIVVNDFLTEHFEKIMSYNFTAGVEDEFDDIANGKIEWTKMLDGFYKDFHKTVEDVIENSDRNTGERILGKDPKTGRTILVRLGRFGPIAQLGLTEDEEKPVFVSIPKELHMEKIALEEALLLLKSAGNGRKVGVHPESGKNIYVRLGRFGPMAQIGELGNKDEKPQYAGLQKGMTVESLTLEEALELFKLPRDLGEYEGKKVVASAGRFGPYIRHDSKFSSLKKTDDPLKVTLERAIELIEEKRAKDKAKLIKQFPENKDIIIMKDRWNRPCIFHEKIYYNLPKNIDATKLTLAQCTKMIEADPKFKAAKKKKEAAAKKKKKPTKRKTTAKKTTARKKVVKKTVKK